MTELDNIRRSALNWLTRRDYSEQELTYKLLAKYDHPTAINAIVKNLVEAGLINDQRFAEHYLNWRRNKGFGPNRIKLELQARGVDRDIITKVFSDISNEDWQQQLAKIYQKYFKNRSPSDKKDQAKQWRFLQQRGFSRSQIENLLPSFESQ